MSAREIQVAIRGDHETEVYSAAYLAIRALEAAGASVGLAGVLPLTDLSGGALRGVRVMVGVQAESSLPVVARPVIQVPVLGAAPGRPTLVSGAARSAKAVVGLAVLLAVVFVEVRVSSAWAHSSPWASAVGPSGTPASSAWRKPQPNFQEKQQASSCSSGVRLWVKSHCGRFAW